MKYGVTGECQEESDEEDNALVDTLCHVYCEFIGAMTVMKYGVTGECQEESDEEDNALEDTLSSTGQQESDTPDPHQATRMTGKNETTLKESGSGRESSQKGLTNPSMVKG